MAHGRAVLRYSPFNAALVDILRSGELGEIVNITHLEPVGHWHFAHSYVRGNWRDEKQSSFALMTKCCQCVGRPASCLCDDAD